MLPHIYQKPVSSHDDGMIISAMQVAVLLPLYAPITQASGVEPTRRDSPTYHPETK